VQETSVKSSACRLLSRWIFCLAYSSTLKTEAICSSETTVGFRRTIWHYIPEDSTHHNRHCDNLKSYKSYERSGVQNILQAARTATCCPSTHSYNQPTPRSRVLLHKLTVAQTLKKFLAFYEISSSLPYSQESEPEKASAYTPLNQLL
jgi:hypothetical protein